MREAFDIVGTSPRVDGAAHLRLFLDVNLRVTGDTCGEVGRQGDGLVQRVGVQRLGVSQRSAHSLDAGTADVVERILLGERPTRGLTVRTQRHGLRVLRVELLHDLGPQHTGGAHLRDLHEVVHTHGPEERQTRRELIDAHARVHTGAKVLQTVGQRVSKLDVVGGTGLLHVVAGDGDGVELRHVLGRELEDVGDDLHRVCRRVNVGVTHHELLEDVVLDGARQLVERGTLLLGGDDVERQDRQHGTVHRHGDGHLVQRNLVEEDLHVEDGVDGDTGFTDITDHARVIGVVAAVRGEVEGHGQALLTSGEVAAVEGVGLLGGGETGILTDGPRAEHIHHRVRSAQIRRDARCVIQMLHA